jgi:hypothetical protein
MIALAKMGSAQLLHYGAEDINFQVVGTADITTIDEQWCSEMFEDS